MSRTELNRTITRLETENCLLRGVIANDKAAIKRLHRRLAAGRRPWYRRIRPRARAAIGI